jgi:PIN domain nuclease of toxin-antitoxin system
MIDAPARLRRDGRRTIAKADRLGVAAVSMWEVSLLAERGRPSLDRELVEWIRDRLGQVRVELLGLTTAVVATAHQLRGALSGHVSRASGFEEARSRGHMQRFVGEVRSCIQAADAV